MNDGINSVHLQPPRLPPYSAQSEQVGWLICPLRVLALLPPCLLYFQAVTLFGWPEPLLGSRGARGQSPGPKLPITALQSTGAAASQAVEFYSA
ncbi:hypothetical protein MHYP_G00333300 [Metynnis hypsauchen]